MSFVEKLKEQVAALPSAEIQLDKRIAEEEAKIGTPLFSVEDFFLSIFILPFSCCRWSDATHCDTINGGH